MMKHRKLVIASIVVAGALTLAYVAIFTGWEDFDDED